jgi:hypothetical protein
MLKILSPLDHFETKGFIKLENVNSTDLDFVDQFPTAEQMKQMTLEELTLDRPIEGLFKEEMVGLDTQIRQQIEGEFNKNIELMDMAIWECSDPKRADWHFDHLPGDWGATADLIVTYYFDSVSEETGGSIDFQYEGVKESHYPNARDIVIINNRWDQQGQWMHRVSLLNDKTHRRRMAGFYYKWT